MRGWVVVLLAGCAHHTEVDDPPAPPLAPPPADVFTLAESCGDISAPACAVDGLDVAKVLLHPEAAVTDRQQSAANAFAAAADAFPAYGMHPMPNLAVQVHNGDASIPLTVVPGRQYAFTCVSAATDLQATMFATGADDVEFQRDNDDYVGVAAVRTTAVETSTPPWIHVMALNDRKATTWVVCSQWSDDDGSPAPAGPSDADNVAAALRDFDQKAADTGTSPIWTGGDTVSVAASTFHLATRAGYEYTAVCVSTARGLTAAITANGTDIAMFQDGGSSHRVYAQVIKFDGPQDPYPDLRVTATESGALACRLYGP